MSINEIHYDKIWYDGYNEDIYNSIKLWSDKRSRSLSSGTSCFLIRDKRFADHNYYFYAWLKNNRFSLAKKSFSCYGNIDWLYINLNSKIYNRRETRCFVNNANM